MNRLLSCISLAILLSCGQIAWANGDNTMQGYRSLISDAKGDAIGKSLTVEIVESLSAETGSRSDVRRSTDFNFGVSANGTYGKELALDAGIGREGGGSLNKETKITSQITATIVDKDDYGRLYIEGSQSLKINDEIQTVELKGWVRYEDIASDNTVLSTRLSNAVINITSEGHSSDATEPGLFYRFFSFLGLI